jgi:hypothetical protein
MPRSRLNEWHANNAIGSDNIRVNVRGNQGSHQIDVDNFVAARSSRNNKFQQANGGRPQQIQSKAIKFNKNQQISIYHCL